MQPGEPGPDRKVPAPDNDVGVAAPPQEGAARSNNSAPQPLAQFTELAQKLLVPLKRIPLKSAGLVLALILLAFAAWRMLYVPETAVLNLKGQHSFRSAELSVWVDGKLAQHSQLVGSTKKRFGFVQQPVQGSFSHSLRVPAGEHNIRISIAAPNEGYSQSEELQAEFQAKTQRTIIITPERRSGRLSLAWRDPQAFTAQTTGSSATGGIFSSLLLTVAGSILSAVVGFFVRERLATMRAKKSQ